MRVKVINNSGFKLPKYETDGAAAFDLKAKLVPGMSIELGAGASTLIPTGLYVEIEKGYELQIRSKSGMALKSSVVVNNSPGTIDSDYRGEIGIILINHGHKPYIISHGDRIAQAVLAKYEQAEWEEVKELSTTKRGEGGFGSTGKQ